MTNTNTQTYPIYDVDFICGVCIFQLAKETCLWAHMDSEHDVRKQTNEDNIKCNFCEQTCDHKSNLMFHKKQIHGMKEPCKYFARGACLFSAEICWYSHDNNDKTQSPNIEEITCKFCGEQFSLKNEFMKHRKSNHNEKVPLCRENEKGTCKFDTNCWYIHRNLNIAQNNEKSLELQSLKIPKMLDTNMTSMDNKIGMKIN